MICNLCPRQCGAERTPEVGKGWCRLPSVVKVARAELHHWGSPVFLAPGERGRRSSPAAPWGACFARTGPSATKTRAKR